MVAYLVLGGGVLAAAIVAIYTRPLNAAVAPAYPLVGTFPRGPSPYLGNDLGPNGAAVPVSKAPLNQPAPNPSPQNKANEIMTSLSQGFMLGGQAIGAGRELYAFGKDIGSGISDMFASPIEANPYAPEFIDVTGLTDNWGYAGGYA